MGEKSLRIETVAVFGGSRLGHNPAYERDAVKLGEILAKQNRKVVVGSPRGLVRAFSDAFIDNGGHLSVLTTPHNCRAVNDNQPNVHTIEVSTDNDRTIELLKRSDAWISLAGSGGTIGETVRGMTWNVDRSYRNRPITPQILLNTAGVYTPLRETYKRAADDGFSGAHILDLFDLVDTPQDVEQLLTRLDHEEQKIVAPVSGDHSAISLRHP